MTTSSAPAAPPMPHQSTYFGPPKPYTPEDIRKYHFKHLRERGATHYRAHVYGLIEAMLKKGSSHTDIAAYLNTTHCERFSRAQPWQATSIRALLKQHAGDIAAATQARKRHRASPRGEDAAARFLKGDIYQPDFQHFNY